MLKIKGGKIYHYWKRKCLVCGRTFQIANKLFEKEDWAFSELRSDGKVGKMDGIDFSHMPCIYWSNKTKISYLQRRVIVYSIMYYEMSESCVSDKQFDAIAYQLVDLQKKDPESHKRSQYYYAMYDFDGSTGFDIPSRLTEHDREYLTQIAAWVQKRWRQSKKEATECSN